MSIIWEDEKGAAATAIGLTEIRLLTTGMPYLFPTRSQVLTRPPARSFILDRTLSWNRLRSWLAQSSRLIPSVTVRRSRCSLIDIQGNVHFVDHDIGTRVVAPSKYGTQLGDVDIMVCQQRGDCGHEPFAVRASGGDNKPLTITGGPFNGVRPQFTDEKVQVEIGRFALQGFNQLRVGIVLGSGSDEDTGELVLENGLADVFDIEVIVEHDFGDGCDDAGAVLAKYRNDHFIHRIVNLLMVNWLFYMAENQGAVNRSGP
jgi:hypothetical protein